MLCIEFLTFQLEGKPHSYPGSSSGWFLWTILKFVAICFRPYCPPVVHIYSSFRAVIIEGPFVLIFQVFQIVVFAQFCFFFFQIFPILFFSPKMWMLRQRFRYFVTSVKKSQSVTECLRIFDAYKFRKFEKIWKKQIGKWCSSIEIGPFFTLQARHNKHSIIPYPGSSSGSLV